MTATTNRPITFAFVHPTTKRVESTHRADAGIKVYYRARRNGGYIVRIPGTLFEQLVTADALSF